MDKRTLIAKVQEKLGTAFFDQKTKEEIAGLAIDLKKLPADKLEAAIMSFVKKNKFTDEKYGLLLDKLTKLYQVAGVSPEHKKVMQQLYHKNPHAQLVSI